MLIRNSGTIVEIDMYNGCKLNWQVMFDRQRNDLFEHARGSSNNKREIRISGGEFISCLLGVSIRRLRRYTYEA